MLILRQNLYVPCGKQHTGRCEAQSHERVNKVKKFSALSLNHDTALSHPAKGLILGQIYAITAHFKEP
jgi:hypothetical protein